MRGKMERLTNILQPHVRASKIRLSYVDELFVELKDNPYIILHENTPEVKLSEHDNEERSFDEYSTKHDSILSGSPLDYSFGNYEFEDTAVVVRQTWRKQEESYLPLSRNDACNTLNRCLECLDNNSLPILALCDGKDPRQSRFIGAIVHEDWFTTLEAVSTGMTTLTAIRNEHQKIIQEHLKRSFVQEQDIKISMFNIFNLFGIKQEMIDWDKTAKSDFEGSINIEIQSNKLTIDPRLSTNTLITQINAGWKNSSLKELRCQLLLLSQYLSIIDEYKKNIEMQKPIKFSTSYSKECDVIMENLNLLLNGDFNFKRFDKSNVKKVDYINKKLIDIDAKLLERVQNIFLRDDVDFTDRLWEILMKASEYSQMISCIEIILEKVLKHKFTPQINDTNSTRFIKHISNLHHQDTISHLLVGSVPLELMVDMGFEKLRRDYLYILRGARFVDLHNVRQELIDLSSGIFNTENYRKKLVTLAQIHICLECMLLIEEHLECPIENLQSLFAYAYKEFVSAQSPLQNYTELCSRIFTLTMPLPNKLINELNKMNPSVCKTSISSQSAALMLTTTTYYSKTPIFPMDIYPIDNTNIQQEIVHGIKATSSSTKYKKL
ncbi:protein zwilch homolog [Anoplolepis gracilipes]|uniref:protein zwilch homolog n=1 Tax=Anoplolepis gracilipes TaxID=354296 RepID=UPI003BA12437